MFASCIANQHRGKTAIQCFVAPVRPDTDFDGPAGGTSAGRVWGSASLTLAGSVSERAGRRRLIEGAQKYTRISGISSYDDPFRNNPPFAHPHPNFRSMSRISPPPKKLVRIRLRVRVIILKRTSHKNVYLRDRGIF